MNEEEIYCVAVEPAHDAEGAGQRIVIRPGGRGGAA